MRTSVLIVGTGFGGIIAARELLQRGIAFTMLERRPFLGGTWKQNTYPGAAVDVQSPLYSLSSDPFDWSQMFAERAELDAYTDHLLAKYRIAEHTVCNATVQAARWDEDAAEWVLTTEDNRSFRAAFVINASGPLSQPAIPAFEGASTFAGPAFHTNDWDHSVDLRGKRVAVIGSGASAAQVIPAIVDDVAALHVFQRSPHWVLPRADRQFTARERRILRRPLAYNALRSVIYWGLETRVIGFKYSDAMLERVAERKARRHLANQVPNAELRAKLTPSYRIGCKRIILSNTLYPALGRAHVTLHDQGDGVASFTAGGLRTTQGTELALDVVVYATGYNAASGIVSYDVVGRGGDRLAARWSPYPRAYLGTSVPKHPNFFVVTGPNTGIGHTSALFVIESQMQYIMQAIEAVRDSNGRSVEVREAAEAAYTEKIHAEMTRTVWQRAGCSSWYQADDGKVIAMFPGFSFTYRRWTSRFDREAHLLA
jgi:cation diffusion facilitator CzcD-associated flavoprotein CzcO